MEFSFKGNTEKPTPPVRTNVLAKPQVAILFKQSAASASNAKESVQSLIESSKSKY
jgi:hypothetical protein